MSHTTASTDGRPEQTPAREAGICLAMALLASAVAIVDFCPQFAYWRGVDNLVAHRAPEYGRANALLAQTSSPLERNFDPMHRVLAWRLLFPMLWHYLHLPRLWLLAMPQVGCVLVLWLVAWLTQRRTADWLRTLLATQLFATFSWFFVSTGWLGYFDSWLVLGLLVAAFVVPAAPFLAACVLTPWVDERFVLALPVTLLVRVIALGYAESMNWRQIKRDTLAALAACAPYLMIRIIALAAGEQDASIYAQAHRMTVTMVPASRFVAGWWAGFRAAWLFLLAGVAILVRQGYLLSGILLGLAVAVCSIGGLFIAADMSRTVMMVCPAILLGVWLVAGAQVSQARWILPGAVIANLLLPAYHELWFQEFPISHLPTEVSRYRGPVPDSLQAADLIAAADALMAEGKLTEAREKLDAAISMQQRYAVAYAQRAALRMRENDAEGSLADVQEALKIDATMPYALFIRGYLRAARGERDGAIADLRLAIRNGGPAWMFRAQAQALLDQIAPQASPVAP